MIQFLKHKEGLQVIPINLTRTQLHSGNLFGAEEKGLPVCVPINLIPLHVIWRKKFFGICFATIPIS